jgi:DNA transposition AAA+ family ATPase
METQVNIDREIKRLQHDKIVAVEQLRSLHAWLDDRRLCQRPGRILGESRTGKTCSVKSYALDRPPSQELGKPPVVPVLIIQVPQDCGAKELYTLIIEALKFKVTKGSTADLRRRAYKQFFADVRDMSDQLDISVVLVGTDRLDAVIGRDEQVKNRFYAHFRMGVLNPVQFEQTVLVWEQQILKLPVPSNLTAKPTLKLLREKTKGYIGILDMILRQSAIAALKKGESKIDIQTLKEVMAGYG